MSENESESRIQAASYLRVSGRGQLRGDGFTRQREAVQRYAQAHGIAIVEEFTEEAVSGTKDLDERPALGALLDRIDSNGVRTVLVERADRFARDLMIQEIILADLCKRGVRVLAADGGMDSGDGNADDPNQATRTLIRQVLGAVSQYDKTTTVWKMKAARQRIRRRDGKCEGRKAFGERPGEQATIDRMKALRVKGLSLGDIARHLDAEGLSTRTGCPWSASVVRRLLLR